jgi:hypothetical protein
VIISDSILQHTGGDIDERKGVTAVSRCEIKVPVRKELSPRPQTQHELEPFARPSPQRSSSLSHAVTLVIYLHLVNRIGTSLIVNVICNFACRTLSCNSPFVSPSISIGSTRQSSKRMVRKQTASVVANLRPMHVRGPICIERINEVKVGREEKEEGRKKEKEDGYLDGLTNAKSSERLRISRDVMPPRRPISLRLRKVSWVIF